MKVKILSVLITVTVLLSAMTVGIYAQNLIMTTTNMTLNGNNVLISNAALEEAVSIDAETAECIAELFVADMILTSDCSWDNETEIVNVVTMYDETGSNVTAYSVELSEGYVIVSAFADTESLIPEWSDAALPIYNELDVTSNESIVYLGSYEYFADNGTSVVTDVSGNEVDKADLVNFVEESRDISNVPESLLETCIVRNGGISLMGNGEYITSPHDHAEAVYGGDFSTLNYYNKWGPYIQYYTGSHHSEVVAVTNMILAYLDREGDPLPTDCPNPGDIAGKVWNEGDDKKCYSNGVLSEDKVDFFIELGFYGVLQKYRTVSGLATATNSTFLSAVENNRLVFLKLRNHPNYGPDVENSVHYVLCFAYTRLVSDTTGYTKTYLKIADGINPDGRYLDLSTVAPYNTNPPTYTPALYSYVEFPEYTN